MDLDYSMSAKKFGVWWLRAGKPFNAPQDAICHVGGFACVTLFREGPFQVQLVIAQPFASAPPHTHPNIDTVEMLVQGTGVVEVFGRPKANGIFTGVAPKDVHTARAAENGASFISIQKWLNGVVPSSVHLDWRGAVIDDGHAQSLGVGERAA